MKKILFVCDYYYPNASSIGICTHKVAKALKQNGNIVHVLSFGDNNFKIENEYDNITSFYIKKRFHERCIEFGENTGGIVGKIICLLGKCKLRLWQILWFPFFRMDGIAVPLRYYRAISKLNKQNNYDMIIATYNPFEGMLATYWYKKKFNNVLFCLYILDNLTNIGNTNYISNKLNDKMGWKWEKRIFPLCDQIINLRCHEKHHQQERYNQFRKKMVYSDIPFLTKNNASKNYFDKKYIHFVYTGRLLKTRSSSSFSKLFDKLSANKPYILHYYSTGDEEDNISKFEKSTNGRIKRHGLLPHDKISIIQNSADILVSIGNSGNEKISSKIFEYISTGKKIVHFQKEKYDSTIYYYSKYDNAIVLSEKDSLIINIEKLNKFITKSYSKIEFEKLKSIYYENLPEYTAILIMKCFT